MVGNSRVSATEMPTTDTMGNDATPIRRGLSPAFRDALTALTDAPDGSWWRDVLARRDLVLAVRDEYLNVYYRGAALFRVERRGEALVPVTHAKYLARRVQGETALLPDGRFALDPVRALWPGYAGPATLAEMMAAAAALAGPEKIGLHPLLLASPHVVDVEITLGGGPVALSDTATDGALVAAEAVAGTAEDAPAAGSAAVSASAPTASPRPDRLDVATLEERDGTVFVVFHEAKHFANPALRAAPDRTPPVAEQIARYRQALAQQAEAIGQAYSEVCRALAAIDAMRRRVIPDAVALHPLIAQVAAEGLVPVVDPEPRLVVFGFDADQRDGAVWSEHRARLNRPAPDGYGLRLHALGTTQGRRRPAFGA